MRNLERIKVILSATNFESLAVCYQLTYELFPNPWVLSLLYYEYLRFYVSWQGMPVIPNIKC